MKVTVCFRDIKVVVPCGDGNGLVRDLLEEAIARYKKALSKTVDNNWITDKTVKLLLSDGGILDLDDKIVDVIDDKEQIQAIFDGNHQMLDRHNDNNGDGTSGSSLGTSSPDIFHDNITERICSGKESSDLQVDDQHDVIITEQDFVAESGLRVRRGSEPTLCTSINSAFDSSNTSAIGGGPVEFPIYGAVCKGSNSRRDPLGSTANSGLKNGHYLVSTGKMAAEEQVVSSSDVKATSSEEQTDKQESELIIVLPKSSEALGIHVVPEFDSTNRNVGLLIEKIEPGGRADHDGRLRQHDRITEINCQNLFGVDFSKAQDIFRSAFLAPELQIKLLRRATSGQSAKSSVAETYDLPGTVTVPEVVRRKGSDSPRKIPPAVPARNPKTQLSSKTTSRLTMQTIAIELIKGAQGLGFSVTTRGILDNGYCPIYVKSIFSEGAAIEDGRLKPGDVLLEINGVSLASKSKAEAVRMLRSSPRGSNIELLVRRAGDGGPAGQQMHVNHKPAIPRPLSTLGFFPRSTSSSSDRADEEEQELEEEQEKEKDQDEIDTTTEDIHGGQRNGMAVSYSRNGFGSLSNLNQMESDEEDFTPNFPAGGKETGPASSLQKSRKSISLDDLRRNFSKSAVEPSFDDDVDFPVAPFNKKRDFNQSFRAAVIDKSCNEPSANMVTRPAKYSVPVQRKEKLKMIEEKKNRNKKENDRGSGRKFGWFFKFGKGKKSADERERSGQSEATSQNAKSELSPSPAKGLPTSEQMKDPLAKSSHLSKYGQYQEQGRHFEGGHSQLNKEDYMITSVTPQRIVPPQNPQGYPKPPMANLAYSSNDPQSFEDHHSQPAGHAHITTGRDDHNTSRDQFYNVTPQRSLNDYSIPLTQNPNVGRDYPEAMDTGLEYYHQENLPPRGGYPPRAYYRDDELLVPVQSHLGFYRQNSPQMIVPGASDPTQDYYRPRESRLVPQLGHYYQREKFDGGHQYRKTANQNRHYYHPIEPYGHDRSWDQCPLDLSQYALKPQHHGGAAYGYKSREPGPQTRQHVPPSDLQILDQPSSIYPQYKEVSPGYMPGVNVKRMREPAKHSHQNSRAGLEQIQRNDLYQARLWQNKVPSTSDRW